MKVAKKIQNTPTCGSSPSEPQTENKKCFFFISSRRLAESVDGLDSSQAQSAGELWIFKGRVKKVARAGLKGSTC